MAWVRRGTNQKEEPHVGENASPFVHRSAFDF